MKSPHFLRSLFLRLIFITIFGLVALWVVAQAAGLKLESESRRVIQTSLLAVASEEKGISVAVNGEELSGRSPWRLDNLEPGTYSVEVTKDGYTSWSKTVSLNPGESASFEDIVLFLTTPVISDFEDAKGQWLDKLTALESEPRIQVIDGNELWYDDELVTRFSTAITQPRFYADKGHISFVSDGWLHVIDVDGSNDNTILKLGSDGSYLFIEKNTAVLFNDNGVLKTAQIR